MAYLFFAPVFPCIAIEFADINIPAPATPVVLIKLRREIFIFFNFHLSEYNILAFKSSKQINQNFDFTAKSNLLYSYRA
jgi:hypothetical protein